MSAITPTGDNERSSVADTFSGYLAAGAMVFAFMSALNIYISIDGVGLAFRPVRVGVAATIASLVAAGMSRGTSRLPMVGAYFCGACWFLGMVIAVVTGRPLY